MRRQVLLADPVLIHDKRRAINLSQFRESTRKSFVVVRTLLEATGAPHLSAKSADGRLVVAWRCLDPSAQAAGTCCGPSVRLSALARRQSTPCPSMAYYGSQIIHIVLWFLKVSMMLKVLQTGEGRVRSSLSLDVGHPSVDQLVDGVPAFLAVATPTGTATPLTLVSRTPGRGHTVGVETPFTSSTMGVKPDPQESDF